MILKLFTQTINNLPPTQLYLEFKFSWLGDSSEDEKF